MVAQVLTIDWFAMGNVVVCTHLPDRELHRQVGRSRVVKSGSLDGVMVNTLAQNVRDVGSIPTLGTIFPFVNTSTRLVSITTIMYNLSDVWLLNIPRVCLCKGTTCM